MPTRAIVSSSGRRLRSKLPFMRAGEFPEGPPAKACTDCCDARARSHSGCFAASADLGLV